MSDRTTPIQTHGQRLERLLKAGLSVSFDRDPYESRWAASVSDSARGCGVFNVGGSTPDEALRRAQDHYELNWPIGHNEV